MLDTGSGTMTEANTISPVLTRTTREVYYEITMPDGEFSDTDIDAATQECIGGRVHDVRGRGLPGLRVRCHHARSHQGLVGANNDRVIQCIVFDPAGQTTGSLAGAAR